MIFPLPWQSPLTWLIVIMTVNQQTAVVVAVVVDVAVVAVVAVVVAVVAVSKSNNDPMGQVINEPSEGRLLCPAAFAQHSKR